MQDEVSFPPLNLVLKHMKLS